MPTIEELFKTKKLISGQTAEQQYDIRNTADIKRTPYNVLMRPSFAIAQLARKTLSGRLSETKLEEEVTGLRILATTTSPIIYGTDILKFSRKTRGIVEDMKQGTGGAEGIGGKLTSFIAKGEKFGNELLSKIGAKLPEDLIPSRIVLNTDFKKSKVSETMVTLTKLKSNSGGNLLGKLIKDNLQGRPNPNQILGSALELGKKKLNTLLLGSPSQAAVNFAKDGGDNYDNDSPYGKVMTGAQYLPEDMIDLRNDLSSKYVAYKTPEVNLPLPITNYIAVPTFSKEPKQMYSKAKSIATENLLEVKKGMADYSKTGKRGDELNRLVQYNSKDGLKPDDRDPNLPTLKSLDFVELKFWSVAKQAAVNFRATLTGITETISPTWDTQKFVGNPFNFYTYSNIERSVNFAFKIYALNADELKACWQKINFLTNLTYPQGYAGNIAVIPPFIRFTLGSMHVNKEAFISDLSYEIPDDAPWEIDAEGLGMGEYILPKVVNVTMALKLVETVGSTYQLAIAERKAVAETKKTDGTVVPAVPAAPAIAASAKRLYGYGASNPNQIVNDDRVKNLDKGGDPLKTTQVSDSPNASAAQKAENPVATAPKESQDPKGIPVEEYKGYKIYLKQNLPYFYMESRSGDGPVAHKGPESRSATQDELIRFEKAWIDNEAGAASAFKEVGKDITNKLNNQSILLGGY
jgi:hypothetical protein